MFFKIKQKLCANVTKGVLQQLCCVHKEQCTINLLETVYNVKLTFTQKQILWQNKKYNLLSANKIFV